MNKTMKTIAALVIMIFMLAVSATPVMAAEYDLDAAFDGHHFFEEYEAFEQEILNAREDFEQEYNAIQQKHEAARQQNERMMNQARQGVGLMTVIWVCLFILALALLIAEMTYIFIAAPKCGMSRFWALVPLFSNFAGLIVFIVVRSSGKKISNKHTVTCPTCNCVHPVGTDICSVCGVAL